MSPLFTPKSRPIRSSLPSWERRRKKDTTRLSRLRSVSGCSLFTSTIVESSPTQGHCTPDESRSTRALVRLLDLRKGQGQGCEGRRGWKVSETRPFIDPDGPSRHGEEGPCPDRGPPAFPLPGGGRVPKSNVQRNLETGDLFGDCTSVSKPEVEMGKSVQIRTPGARPFSSHDK